MHRFTYLESTITDNLSLHAEINKQIDRVSTTFARLTIMDNEDTDLDSMITTFNTAVIETASEILGKHRQKKTPRVTAENLDLCDKRRELRKKRFEPEGSEKYKEVNNNIKRCMKKAKEKWIGEQCNGIEKKSEEEQQ